jgi:hypothetical protein
MEAYFLAQEKPDEPIARRELTPEQNDAINNLLEAYKDIFASELHELGQNNVIQHVIDTGTE